MFDLGVWLTLHLTLPIVLIWLSAFVLIEVKKKI